MKGTFSHIPTLCCMAGLLCPVSALATGEEETRIDDAEMIEIQSGGQETESILIDEQGGADGGSEILLEYEAESPEVEAGQKSEEDEGVWRLRLPVVRVETGSFGSGSSADRLGFGQIQMRAEHSQGPWVMQLEARLDAYHQAGDTAWDEVDVDYGETFVRYRRGDWRFTLGTQTLIWGRLDEIPLADRLSRVDAKRLLLDDLPDRRRALPALRVERYFGNHSLDLVILPAFQPAVLPDHDSVWYPVRRSTGEILGVDLPVATRALVRNAAIHEDAPGGYDGFGLRYTYGGSALDLGITLERTRQSLPYFRLDLPGNRLVAEYPRSWLAGFDFGLDTGSAVWRWEMAWLSDVPVTHAAQGYDTRRSFLWGGAVEFHPGETDARVNLQLAGTHLLDAGGVLDRQRVYNFNGSIDLPFAHERWQLVVRWFLDLNDRNLYVNPKLVFLGWEPSEIYLAWHAFAGDPDTLGGFYEHDDLITFGWRTAF